MPWLQNTTQLSLIEGSLFVIEYIKEYGNTSAVRALVCLELVELAGVHFPSAVLVMYEVRIIGVPVKIPFHSSIRLYGARVSDHNTYRTASSGSILDRDTEAYVARCSYHPITKRSRIIRASKRSLVLDYVR